MTTPTGGFPVEGDLHSSDRVVRWAHEPRVPLAETTLSNKESTILDFLRADANQNLTPMEIASRSPLNGEETLSILYHLIDAGVLELGERTLEPDLSSTLASDPAKAPPASAFASIPFPKKLGRFEVERPLGRGSMGAVLLAKDPAIDRVVAIKLVQTAAHLSPGERDKYRERFYREASAAGQLLHPAIATIFDVGHAEDGTPFLVMEHVKGKTLRELLESGKPPLAETIQIARDVLEALSFAHAQGIVHRDVKPANIIVGPDSRGKIMDFGIAHVLGSELTSDGDVLGSPYYMAPEQLAKGPITARTDLFSFAVVLYRMLTGVHPFTGDSFAAVAHAVLHEEPVPPDRIDPGVPRAISSLVLRCLEKSPEDRFASASDVLQALTAAESGKAVTSAPRMSGVRRLLWLAAALVLLVLATRAIRAPEPSTAPVFVAPTPAPTPGPDEPLTQPPPTDTVLAPPERTPQAIAPSLEAPRQTPRTARAEPAEDPEHDVPPKGPSVEASAEPVGTDHSHAKTEADLFYQARVALERGALEESRATLETLLSRDPTFAGASELYRSVTDQIWETRLPLRLPARHKHRLGGCEGELSLASLGVRFQSPAHDWAFRPKDIRVMERPEETTVIVETFEKDTFILGKNKRYRFDLETPLSDADWARYQRLLK